MNHGLLQAIMDSKHPSFAFDWVDISHFPIYDEDIEKSQVPEDVKRARSQVYKADAILFGVAEYNFTVSSPLKNAYDWLSRDFVISGENEPWNKNGAKSPIAEKVGAMVSVGGM
jgi:NAD(P)H-dependent FMN reductase